MTAILNFVAVEDKQVLYLHFPILIFFDNHQLIINY